MTVVTIGRSSECDVVINDPYVGRTHLQIVVDNGKYYCVDLNSKNGTFVNGRQITGKVQLNENDIIRIGNTTVPWQQYIGVPKTNKSRKPFWITMIAAGVVLLVCVGLGIYYNNNSEPNTEREIISSLKEFGHSQMPASFKNLWSDDIDMDVAFKMWKEIKQSGNRYGIDWTSLEHYDSYHKTKEIDNETFTYGALMMSFNSSMDYMSYLVWYIADSSGKIVVLNDNWNRQLITIDDKILDSLNDLVDDFTGLKKDIVRPKKSHLQRTNAKPTAGNIQTDLIGHKLSEGVSDGFFRTDWTYEIVDGSISNFQIEEVLTDNTSDYSVIASFRLKGGRNFYYATRAKIRYIFNSKNWEFDHVTSLGMSVVSDGMYDDCLSFEPDWDWSRLYVRNLSEYPLEVGLQIQTKYFGLKKVTRIVRPNNYVCFGAIGDTDVSDVQDYVIEFIIRH